MSSLAGLWAWRAAREGLVALEVRADAWCAEAQRLPLPVTTRTGSGKTESRGWLEQGVGVPLDWVLENLPTSGHEAARGRERSLFYVACSRVEAHRVLKFWFLVANGRPYRRQM